MTTQNSVAPEKILTPKTKAQDSKPPEEVPLPLEAETLASGAGTTSRLDLDYIFGSTQHCLWAMVANKSYYKWLNDDQIKTIVHVAFNAPQVSIQYNVNGQIERVRPIKTF